MLIKRALTVAAGAALALPLAACGSTSTPAATPSAATTSEPMAVVSTGAMSGAMSGASGAVTSGGVTSGAVTSGATDSATGRSVASGATVPATLVGPGCADYAAAVPTGAGSVAGMAEDPVAVAAKNNPRLTSLAAAVSGTVNPRVNLVSSLDNGQFTVFAPVDEAFAKIDAATMDKFTTDAALLTGILTYHVVPGRLSPGEVVGTHRTVNGATLEVIGSGDLQRVNGANVICGGVQTKNATVYLIDRVLLPPRG
jgi:uncharacterized surface protein with fasciclin (FAS1) repeats